MSKRAWIVLGVLLIVLGTAALVYNQITYTTSERILEVGPVEATREVEKSIPLPPVLAATVLGVGVAALLVGARKTPP